MKILLAVDGSECSLRAVNYLAKHFRRFGDDLKLTLLHVDVPFLQRVVTELGQEIVAQLHKENSEHALKGARSKLKRAQIPYEEKTLVGDVGESIANLAQAGKYDMVIMGSHGRSAFSGLLMGSVTTKVIAHCSVPVLAVR